MFDLTPEESTPFERRLTALQIVLSLLFAGVALTYWRIQVIEGPEYQDQAENNRQRRVVLRAPRGVILDRNGQLMVDNRPSYDAVVIRDEMRFEGGATTAAEARAQERETIGRAARILRLGPAELAAYGERARVTPTFRSLTLKADLTMAELTYLLSRREELHGVSVSREPRRNYVGGELLAHAVGYVGEVSDRELTDPKYQGLLRPGDLIGRSGIEASYNIELTGRPGQETLIVDSFGRQHGATGERQDAVPGRTMLSTIDLDLQKVAKEAFEEEGYNGAAVVLDPNSGEVLVMLSEPSYDPNLFSGRIARADWRRLQSDSSHPLQNRAIQSRYPPGSTFKLLEAIAGLEERILTPQSTRVCRGASIFYGRAFKCHKKGGHGSPDLRLAIQKSCNGYFYAVGNQLGIERIAKWGALFGLGKPTGIDLPGENPGILPSDAWKRRTIGEKWYPGETISVAIGQGYVQVTPVQLANFYAAIANGGDVYRPHLVRAIYDLNGRLVKEIAPEVISHAPMSEATHLFVKDALWSVVNEWGTARKAMIEGRDVCGKTGTAQVTSASAGIDAEKMDESIRDHAWFAGFAPRDNPEIAFCVFVEHGGHGGVHSAPIARKILEAYFAKKERGGATAVKLASR